VTRPLTIVVGTGRCGSTLLSRALAAHSRVLSLSEFFVCLSPIAFPAGKVDGAALWSILAQPRRKPNELIRAGGGPDEFTYPASGRFRPGHIPAISLVTLPGLTDDPDDLYDELAAWATARSAAAISEHYAALFEWLCERFGRTVIVERSGGSLRFVRQLAVIFPAARFVHLYRNGPDCALSMSRHDSFRLAVQVSRMHRYLGVDPYHQPATEDARLVPIELRPYLPDSLDLRRLRSCDIDVATFGSLWSQQLLQALPDLRALGDRLLSMSYDEMLVEPEHELTRFALFARVPHADTWASRTATLVDRRNGGAHLLSGAARARLAAACAPGTRVLARIRRGPGTAVCV
jgi:Sulfotransferase family